MEQRPIKFRLWNLDNNRMHWPDYIPNQMGSWMGNSIDAEYEEHDGCMIETCPPNYGGPIREYILMQYTGLEDRDGREVYEGDIISLYNDQECRTWGEVCMIDGAWMVCSKTERRYLGLLLHHSRTGTDEGTIIGNVFENHKLLEDSLPTS